MAGFAVSSTIVIGGAQDSLRLALQRLGADIIVVRSGTEKSMENAFLMGVPARTWMAQDVVDRVAAVPGVEAASPQYFLSTLRGANCCSVPEMFLVAYDPATDFTLRPWLEEHHVAPLGTGEAIGGAFVYLPADQTKVQIYGTGLALKATLEPTGTGLDQSMFFTLETAREVARLSPTFAEESLDIPSNSISAAMVRTRLGSDSRQIAQQIRERIPGVTPVESTNLFQSQRVQIAGLLRSVVVLLGITWLLSVSLVGMVHSMAVNERRRDIGVLRALGFSRRWVFQSLLAEGVILAAAGAVAGCALSGYGVYLFRDLLIQSLGVPFLFPSLPSLLALSSAATGIALASTALGALLPTIRIGRLEPALAMRK
jgi:putative ABC transport system permease protein